MTLVILKGTRHSGLDPESISFLSLVKKEQMGPGFRRDDVPLFGLEFVVSVVGD